MILTMLYYGGTFSLQYLGLDIYTNMLIDGSFGYASAFFNAFLITIARRKLNIIVLFCIATLVAFSFIFLKEPNKLDSDF